VPIEPGDRSRRFRIARALSVASEWLATGAGDQQRRVGWPITKILPEIFLLNTMPKVRAGGGCNDKRRDTYQNGTTTIPVIRLMELGRMLFEWRGPGYKAPLSIRKALGIERHWRWMPGYWKGDQHAQ